MTQNLMQTFVLLKFCTCIYLISCFAPSMQNDVGTDSGSSHFDENNGDRIQVSVSWVVFHRCNSNFKDLKKKVIALKKRV